MDTLDSFMNNKHMLKRTAAMLTHNLTGNESTVIYSLEAYNDYIFIHNLLPSFVYIFLLLIVGLPGNIMVCLYYLTKHQHYDFHRNNLNKKHKRLTTSHIFILALACFDLISCSIAMPIELVLLRNYVTFDHPWLCKISRYVSMFCTTSTSFVLLAIVISRFLGIKKNVHMTNRHAKIIVFSSVIVAIGLSSPMLFLYGTFSFITPFHLEMGKTCLVVNEYAKIRQYGFIMTICLLSFHVIFDVIFFVLYGLISGKVVNNRRTFSTISRRENSQLRKDQDEAFRKSSMLSNASRDDTSAIVCASLINTDDVFSLEPTMANIDKMSHASCKLSKEKKKSEIRKLIRIRSSSSRRSNKSVLTSTSGNDVSVHGRIYNVGRTTFMMFIVTLVFMVTFAPYCVIALLRNLNSFDNYNTLPNAEKSVFQLFLRSYFLSSAINPIIYNFLNRYFRKRCKQTVKHAFIFLFCREKA